MPNVLQQRFPELAMRTAGMEAGKPHSTWSQDARSPELLIKRWLAGLRLEEYGAYALSGVGDGSHLEALLGVLPRGACVFCGEVDVGVFASFCSSERGQRLLADHRLYFGAGSPDDAFFASMASFPVVEARNAEPLIFAPLFNEAPSYYREFFLQFARHLDYWRKLIGTNIVNSGLWQSNTIANLSHLITAPDVSDFEGAFKGCSMVVASAGPSLDESLDFLRWARSRAIVVAVNSSFRALRNAGIDPHFVLAADPNESTDKGFRQVDTGTSILVCPFIVYPQVVARFIGRTITWSSSNFLVSYLRMTLGLKQGGHVTEQGTVSACAFDLATIFGCSSVYFVGQDLAVREDGRTHASDSFYTDEKANQTDLKRCRMLPGNTIERVPVEEKLFVYVKTFEEMARRYGSSMRLMNLSRLGARLEGIPYLALDAAKATMPEVGEDAIGSAWQGVRKQCSEEWIPLPKANEFLAQLADYAQDCCSLALRAAMKMEMTEDAGVGRVPLEEMRAARDELEARLQSSQGFWRVLSDGQLKYELYEYNKEVQGLEDGLSEEERAWGECRAYFWSIAEGCYRLLSDLRTGESQAAHR